MASPQKIERYYNAFREISKIVHSSTQLEEILELMVWKASEILDAKGALLRIIDLESGDVAHQCACGLSDAYLKTGPITETLLRQNLTMNRRVIVIADAAKNPRLQNNHAAVKEGIAAAADMPLRFRDNIGGILRILFSAPRDFSHEDISFLSSLAEQCVCAIDKARFIEDQRERYTRLALQTEKLSALGRLAAGVAHEINNPLTAILLYTSNLYKKSAQEGPFREGLGIIMRETQRCKGIIHDLLEFSRAHEPDKVVISLNTIIDRSLKILENELRLRFIEVDKKLSTSIPDSLLDENQMEQVFVNLLLNAAQAIEQRGNIIIESFVDDARRQILARVSDTGPGIAPENLDKIFDPFFSTKKSGSGLGLAVSYGIVQSHGGTLSVENLAGGGCRFGVSLPVLDKEPINDG